VASEFIFLKYISDTFTVKEGMRWQPGALLMNNANYVWICGID